MHKMDQKLVSTVRLDNAAAQFDDSILCIFLHNECQRQSSPLINYISITEYKSLKLSELKRNTFKCLKY